ncbi:hypothetical protein FSP39_003200 [Pinctada imbricata]|uniref:Reverse transcriptase domain-containing protein n=1 Tax=Pinctada imbricata TaxID=66713 RepID=A0AA88YVF4_PINIB|nr:hypothetical protein FSP39_003200 [Pinctada imbricata]
MITHLSYPPGNSINDFIDPSNSTVQYTSFDEVIQSISMVGQASLLGKMDIKSAFRLLRVRPEDFQLLGISFQDKYYIDKCLPFGCAISCNLFEKFATFLEWVIKSRTGVTTIHHYLDDFIFIGDQQSTQCHTLMNNFKSMCLDLGIPLNDSKTEGPCTSLVFLGLEIDTIAQTIKVPQDKLNDLKDLLTKLSKLQKTTLKDLQSLVGKLNFVTKAIHGSRAFNRRFYTATIGVRKPPHFIRITSPLKEDIKLWLKFLGYFNGTAYFQEIEWTSNSTLHLYTDSAGNPELGCGTVFGSQWVALKWPKAWANDQIIKDITFLELVPIVLAMYIWNPLLRNKRILFHIDNMALVNIVNSQSSKSALVMSFLRPLVLLPNGK